MEFLVGDFTPTLFVGEHGANPFSTPGENSRGGWADKDGLIQNGEGVDISWQDALDQYLSGSGCLDRWDIIVDGDFVCVAM